MARPATSPPMEARWMGRRRAMRITPQHLFTIGRLDVVTDGPLGAGAQMPNLGTPTLIA